MNILDYAIAKKLFGGSGSGEVSGTIEINTNGTYNVAKYARANVNVASSGGGESGVPIKVATLPTPTAEDAGKVYLNTTEGNHYVCELRGGSLTVGGTLGDKIYFDTSVNPMAYMQPNIQEYLLGCLNSTQTDMFAIQVADILGGSSESVYGYAIVAMTMRSVIGVIYVDCNAMTVEEFNQGMGVSITAFGWQTDVLDTSAFADYVIQFDDLASYGNLAYSVQVPTFEKANEEYYSSVITDLQSEKDVLQSEKDVLQEQYDEANNWAGLLENSARELYIPDGTTLEDGSLAKCTNLAKVSLPSLNKSFYYMFGKNKNAVPSSLTAVDIRGGALPAGSFSELKNLNSVVIGDSVTGIGNNAFWKCSNLENVTIGNGVITIGSQAFYWCTSLTSIVIPDSVTTIGVQAFLGCTNLTNATISNNITKISSNMFYDCVSLTNVTIPNSVTSIDSYAFSGCDSLTSITIPDSVTSFGIGAFGNCASLTNITIPASVTTIDGNNPFWGCHSLKNINVSENNATYKSIDGNLYTKNGEIFIQYASGKTEALFTLPDSVTSIGVQAFGGCGGIASITIPESVTSIGNWAFTRCSSLTSITIKATTPPTVGTSIFNDCTALSAIYVPAESVEAYKSATNWSVHADKIQAIVE